MLQLTEARMALCPKAGLKMMLVLPSKIYSRFVKRILSLNPHFVEEQDGRLILNMENGDVFIFIKSDYGIDDREVMTDGMEVL